MFRYFLNKNDSKKGLLCLLVVFFSTALFLSIPEDGIGQFWGGWPASFFGGNGFFSAGVSGYGSYMTGPALYSPTNSFPTGGQGLYNASPLTG